MFGRLKMSNRVYPEVVASYENKNYLVYLYECIGEFRKCEGDKEEK